MKQNKTPNTDRANLSIILHVVALALVSFTLPTRAGAAMGGVHRMGQALEAGDVVYVDSGNPVDGGAVFKMNPRTGERSVVSMGGELIMPHSVVVDARSGMLLVSDSGRLVAVDPRTGGQVVIVGQGNAALGTPYGMDIDARGDLLVATAQAVVRMDGRDESLQVVSAGGQMGCPIAVAAGRNGELYVLNWSNESEVIRVNARTGEQTVLTRGGMLNRPQAIAVAGEDIYVTDVAGTDANFGTGRVIHIDAATGEQSLVAEGGHLVGPVGIAVGMDGELLVSDPYTINSESPDLYDGGVVRIHPATGGQTLLARGEGGFVNPRGIAVVISPSH